MECKPRERGLASMSAQWTWPEWSEPEMRLPRGYTCSDCANFRKCAKFLGQKIAQNRVCDWSPSRFAQKTEAWYEIEGARNADKWSREGY